MNLAPLDLKASKSCMLSLIDATAPSGPIEPADLDRWITHVVLPGSATVLIDGHEIHIPEGEHKWVRSESMTYQRVAA